MTPTPAMHQPFLQKDVKLITCVLPDDGSDKALMQALRHEKQVVTSSSIACRGIAVLQSAKSKGARLPVSTLVRRVDVAVAEDEADALFDYIYDKAGIGRKGGGVIFMGPLTSMTPFELPDGLPDEKAH